MSETPVARRTARRNVVQRIDRFLAALALARREPTAYEAHHVLQALEYLSLDQYAAGEDAMLRAERFDIAPPSWIAEVKPLPEPVTLTQLRERAAAALAEE